MSLDGEYFELLNQIARHLLFYSQLPESLGELQQYEYRMSALNGLAGIAMLEDFVHQGFPLRLDAYIGAATANASMVKEVILPAGLYVWKDGVVIIVAVIMVVW